MQKKINKKYSILFIILLSSFGLTNAQKIFFEDFSAVVLNSLSVGNIPESWTLYNDENTPNKEFSYINEAWKVTYNSKEENKYAISTSWFTSPRQANRWLISPAIDIPENSLCRLLFKAISLDAGSPEGYLVLLSSAGKEKESFTDTLHIEKTCPGNWTSVSVNLDKYVNKTVHIAFVLNSFDRYALALDDIEISDFSQPEILLNNIQLPLITSLGHSVQAIVSAQSLSIENVKSFKINTLINDTLLLQFDTIIASSQENGMPFFSNFTFKTQSFIPIHGGEYSFDVWISDLNQNPGVFSDTISSSVFVETDNLFTFRPLLEVFSSSTCVPCATANPFIREAALTLNANKKDGEITAIKYQVNVPSVGDPAYIGANTARFNYYKLFSAPSVILNGKQIKSPTGDYKDLGDFIISQTRISGLNKTPFSIKLHVERVDSIPSIAKFMVNTQVLSLRSFPDTFKLFVAFIEDSVTHNLPQANKETEFFYINRLLKPSFDGETIVFPKSETEHTFNYSFSFDGMNPKIFNGFENISVIAFLQNPKTGEIVQSASFYSSDIKLSKEVITNTEIEDAVLYPNPVQDKAYLILNLNKSCRINLELYRISGQKVYSLNSSISYPQGKSFLEIPTNKLTKGLYILKIKTTSGEVSRKVVKL